MLVVISPSKSGAHIESITHAVFAGEAWAHAVVVTGTRGALSHTVLSSIPRIRTTDQAASLDGAADRLDIKFGDSAGGVAE